MKTNLYGWLVITMMAFASLGFAACGSDDDGNGSGGDSGLAGKWRCVYNLETEYKMNNGQWVEYKTYEHNYGDDEQSNGFIFNSNGTAQLIYVKGDGSYILETNDDFKWKTQNGHLFLLEDDPNDTDGWEDWGGYKLNGTTLEISYDDIDEGYREVSISRYQKM